MKQCINCKTIMADTATFCPKCGTPSATNSATPTPTIPTAPATPPVPPTAPASATPVTQPLVKSSSAINGFGAIASNPTPPPVPAPAPTPPVAPTTPTNSVDPLVATQTTTKPSDSEPITPDTPPTPLKDKKFVSSKGLKMPGKRTLILIAVAVALLIGIAVVIIMFVLPSGNKNTANTDTPVAPAVETPAQVTTNKALLSGFSFEVPGDYTTELFTDINGNPVLQIANSDNSWVMDLTYLGATLFSAVSAEGAIDNQIMLLNAQTNSESASGQATLSDLDIHYIATNYNNTPATIFYATAPTAEGTDPCTFAGIIVSSNGESGEPVLAPAAEILASAQISANPLNNIVEGADFSGLISILDQGFTTPITPEETE